MALAMELTLANGHQQKRCKQRLDEFLGVDASPLGTSLKNAGQHTWGHPMEESPGTRAGSLPGARHMTKSIVDSPDPPLSLRWVMLRE